MGHRCQCLRHYTTTQCRIQGETNNRAATSRSMRQIHRYMSNNCWYDVAGDSWALQQRIFLCWIQKTKDHHCENKRIPADRMSNQTKKNQPK